MHITKERTSPSELQITIGLSAEEMDAIRQKKMREWARDVRIPGFRPGKAPENLAAQHVNTENLNNEVTHDAMSAGITEFLADNTEEILDVPHANHEHHWTGSGEYSFTLSVNVMPDVALPNYEKIAAEITAKKSPARITAKDVDAALAYLQKSRATTRGISRPLQTGDVAHFAYHVTIAGEQMPAEQQTAILGETKLIAGITEALTGMTDKEEKDITITMPKDYLVKNIAGKEAQLHLTVTSTEELVLPEMTDEFVQQLGAFQTVADLKSSIKSGLETEKQQEVREKKRTAFLDELNKSVSFPLPASLVAEEQQRMLQDFAQRLTESGMDFERYLTDTQKTAADIIKDFQPQAERKLKYGIMLRKIAALENLLATDKEIEDRINSDILRFTDNAKETLAKIDLPALQAYTADVIRNEKVFEHLGL